jgi:hypothetical protein
MGGNLLKEQGRRGSSREFENEGGAWLEGNKNAS